MRGVALAALVALVGGGCGGDDPRGGVADRTVELTARLSRFEPTVITVRAGTTVRFVVRNEDPIDHELIVGDDEVHGAHETGTEPYHLPRPGEVTARAGETVSTTYRFDRPGEVVFACHLPGHFAYGMRGTVHVTA
ncbi:MAG: multicopper oxidase domain-containing protein [Actinobacteria bacterium]|nr:multicopper oxidase domain-containing protein [Actinomycetota bacterium]